MSDATLDQVLRAVQNGNRNIRNHLRRQDKMLQGLAGNQETIIRLLSNHSDRSDRLEKRIEVLEEHAGI